MHGVQPKAKGKAHGVGAPKGRSASPRRQALLAIEKREPEQAEEMQTHCDDEETGRQPQHFEMRAHNLAEYGCGRAKRDEDGQKPATKRMDANSVSRRAPASPSSASSSIVVPAMKVR